MAKYTTELHMQQGWRRTIQKGFLPAVVRVGWSRSAMLIEAELGDCDMFNPAKNFNDVAFELGDVFEIFVRPETQDAYYEFHVTPTNQLLQLRIPREGDIHKPKFGKTMDQKLAPYKVWNPKIQTKVKVDTANNKWTINAQVPFVLVMENGKMQPGMRWFCSFCRYDYTRHPANVVHASTSPHKKFSFHRLHEWTPIVYKG
jgi:hypothetical protein